jgi:hypothetical protein
MQGILSEKRFLIIGICLAISFWFFESIVHSLVFKHGLFFQELFPLYDIHELWMRMFICLLFIVFGVYAQYIIDKRMALEKEKENLIVNLQNSLEEIKTLRNILPICASCKKVRDDKGYWHQLEIYLRDHSQTEFSHGLCPDCVKKLYPNYLKTQSGQDVKKSL